MITLDVESWGTLLGQIGATPSPWRFDGHLSAGPPEWQIKLSAEGIEVDLDEVEIDPSTGLYLFKGQQVLIYIKYTRLPRETLLYDKEKSRRFHFRDCRTIQRMKDENRFQRYVAISRLDGLFPVISEEKETGEERELEAPLGPCKNCLSEANYQSYADRSERRQAIWERFAIEEFFATYSSAISYIPVDCCSAIDPSKYAVDWRQKSHEVRTRARWICSECHVRLERHRRLLHVHHVDHDKSNNWLHNLRPLCVLCHQAQPHHARMYVSVADAQRIKELRREQELN